MQPPSDDEASTAAPSSAEESQTDWDSVLEHKVIPPWNARLAEEQIAEWAVIENKLGIVRSVRGWLAAKKKALTKARKVTAVPPDVSGGKTFYPAACYNGAVNGYVFGTRLDELGYHADLPEQVVVPPRVTRPSLTLSSLMK